MRAYLGLIGSIVQDLVVLDTSLLGNLRDVLRSDRLGDLLRGEREGCAASVATTIDFSASLHAQCLKITEYMLRTRKNDVNYLVG